MAASARRRLAAVVAAGLLPWTILVLGGELTFVFTFGLFNTNPPQLVSVYDFFFRYTDGLPDFISAWGTGVLLYLLAVASAIFFEERIPSFTTGVNPTPLTPTTADSSPDIQR